MDRLKWIPLPRTQSTVSDLMQAIENPRFDKDWKDLRFAPWRFFYLDYHHHLQPQDQTMEQWLSSEWTKVHDFYMLKKGEIERRVSIGDPKEIKTLQLDLRQLYHFAKLNYGGFLRLFMQYHRLFGSGPPPTDSLRRLMIHQPFWDNSDDFFSLILPFNRLCLNSPSIIPRPQGDISSGSSTMTKQSLETVTAIDESSIKKYWLHPDHVIELYLLLSIHQLEMQDQHINPSSSPLGADEIGHPYNQKEIQEDVFRGRVKMTTVYLDTPDLNDYKDRLIDQSDTLSCTRTLRTRSFEGVPHVSVEQKMYYHHPQAPRQRREKEPQSSGTLTTLAWIQQRIWMKQKYLQPWLNSNYSFTQLFMKPGCLYRTDQIVLTEKDIQRMKETALYLQEQVHHKTKIPVLKTTQYRTVFANKEMTLTIDTDISFRRPHTTETMIRFPYCVVQIQHHTKPPPWFNQLESLRLFEPVHDFSISLHGLSQLYPVEVYPPWLTKFSNLDIRYPRSRGRLFSQLKSIPPVHWSTDTMITIETISSSSSCSSLTNPQELRRSFDSYCSFDHPTSSKSDPMNCKSCQNKLYSGPKKSQNKPLRSDITFFSVVKTLFSKGEEKQRLLPQHHSPPISRATIMTISCVVTSFIISYLLYLFILHV